MKNIFTLEDLPKCKFKSDLAWIECNEIEMAFS